MIKLLIAGDFCPRDKVHQFISSKDDSFLNDVRSELRGVDYSIVNFETTIANSEFNPIIKCGPSLKTTKNSIDILKNIGFNCVTLANNHFRDYGDESCKETIETLRDNNIDYLGGGINLADSQKILYKEIENKKIAFINFCENEFSIATTEHSGSAPMDVVDNYYQIKDAKKNADYVVVIIHGGVEHYNLPTPRMKKLYRYYIDLGADVVINHHQHCYSGYEFYKEKLIVYGLGNFSFYYPKASRKWSIGYMAKISIENKNIMLDVVPYTQEDVYIRLLKDAELDSFEEDILKLNVIIQNDEKLAECFKQLVDQKKNHYISAFVSYNNKILDYLMYKQVLPYPINKNNFLRIENILNCESHRDIAIAVIKNINAN